MVELFIFIFKYIFLVYSFSVIRFLPEIIELTSLLSVVSLRLKRFALMVSTIHGQCSHCFGLHLGEVLFCVNYSNIEN